MQLTKIFPVTIHSKAEIAHFEEAIALGAAKSIQWDANGTAVTAKLKLDKYKNLYYQIEGSGHQVGVGELLSKLKDIPHSKGSLLSKSDFIYQ